MPSLAIAAGALHVAAVLSAAAAALRSGVQGLVSVLSLCVLLLVL